MAIQTPHQSESSAEGIGGLQELSGATETNTYFRNKTCPDTTWARAQEKSLTSMKVKIKEKQINKRVKSRKNNVCSVAPSTSMDGFHFKQERSIVPTSIDTMFHPLYPGMTS